MYGCNEEQESRRGHLKVSGSICQPGALVTVAKASLQSDLRTGNSSSEVWSRVIQPELSCGGSTLCLSGTGNLQNFHNLVFCLPAVCGNSCYCGEHKRVLNQAIEFSRGCSRPSGNIAAQPSCCFTHSHDLSLTKFSYRC